MKLNRRVFMGSGAAAATALAAPMAFAGGHGKPRVVVVGGGAGGAGGVGGDDGGDGGDGGGCGGLGGNGGHGSIGGSGGGDGEAGGGEKGGKQFLAPQSVQSEPAEQ